MSEVLRVRVDAAHEGGRLRPHAVHLRRGVREDVRRCAKACEHVRRGRLEDEGVFKMLLKAHGYFLEMESEWH